MDRESELRTLLAKIAEKHQAAFRAEAKSIIDELVKIEMSKPPRPVIGPDGKTHVYIGPWPPRLKRGSEHISTTTLKL